MILNHIEVNIKEAIFHHHKSIHAKYQSIPNVRQLRKKDYTKPS
ncbi:hypothetical protein [Flagellimonas eckloniae]|nr:hypothetical protein [Allomuricauda eckloniae]